MPWLWTRLYSCLIWFHLGGHNSGVPLHIHGPGYSEVISGLKRWFIFPANKEPRFDPTRTVLQWLDEVYPTLETDEGITLSKLCWDKNPQPHIFSWMIWSCIYKYRSMGMYNWTEWSHLFPWQLSSCYTKPRWNKHICIYFYYGMETNWRVRTTSTCNTWPMNVIACG